MSIASGGVAVRLPRMNVTSRPMRRVAADERAAGPVPGPAARTGPPVFTCDDDGDDGVGDDDGVGVVVMSGDRCGMDGPRSGMCPSLSYRSAAYALSSYAFERT
jgi:hypothetical protein